MENTEDRVRIHLIIQGRVQGVFFRSSILEQTSRMRLTGWVRNCPDGSVEIVAEGLRKKIQDLIGWCHHGPPGAHVHNVRLHWEDFKGEFQDFHIRR